MIKKLESHTLYEVWNEMVGESVFTDHEPTKTELFEIIKLEEWFRTYTENEIMRYMISTYIKVYKVNKYYTQVNEMISKYYVYILECRDGTYYTGYSTDPFERTKVHNLKRGAKYTRARLPVKLVFYEEFTSKSAAMKKEYWIKQLSRKQKEDLVWDRMGT